LNTPVWPYTMHAAHSACPAGSQLSPRCANSKPCSCVCCSSPRSPVRKTISGALHPSANLVSIEAQSIRVAGEFVRVSLHVSGRARSTIGTRISFSQLSLSSVILGLTVRNHGPDFNHSVSSICFSSRCSFLAWSWIPECRCSSLEARQYSRRP